MINMSSWDKAVRDNKKREADLAKPIKRAERDSVRLSYKKGFIPWWRFDELINACEIQTGEARGHLKKQQWCPISHSAYRAIVSLQGHQANPKHWRQKLSHKQITLFWDIWKDYQNAPLERIRASQTPVEGWDFVANHTGDESGMERGFEPNLNSEGWRDI